MKKSPDSTAGIQRQLLWRLGISLPILCIFISVIAAMPLYLQINVSDDIFLRQTAASLLSDSILWTADDNSKDKDNERILSSELTDFLELSEDDLWSQDFAFTVWDSTGQQLDGDGNGVILPHRHRFSGFVDSDKRWKRSAWRVYYHFDTSSGQSVAVAQTWQSRWQGMQAMIIEQLGILLLTLPLLLVVVIVSVRLGLRPLLRLAQTLNQRHAHDLAPVTQAVPTELQPLTTALNQLLARVSQTMAREQRFTADAAHELRSPLAAIKVQTEELMLHLPHIEPVEIIDKANENAVSNNRQSLETLQRIQRTTDRATHLIDQLLTMAQLDNHQQLACESIDWLVVSESALQSVSLSAREKCLNLKRHIAANTPENVLPLSGDPMLLTLLLRNLLDNAIRYSVDGNDGNSENNDYHNIVELTLAHDHITVRDYGKGIPPKHLNRVRERFFRPAGQNEIGSGLGLSIVERIVELHGLIFKLDNHVDGGVVAVIKKV